MSVVRAGLNHKQTTPDALREETAILDAMDDEGEVLADDVDGEQLCNGASTPWEFGIPISHDIFPKTLRIAWAPITPGRYRILAASSLSLV